MTGVSFVLESTKNISSLASTNDFINMFIMCWFFLKPQAELLGFLLQHLLELRHLIDDTEHDDIGKMERKPVEKILPPVEIEPTVQSLLNIR